MNLDLQIVVDRLERELASLNAEIERLKDELYRPHTENDRREAEGENAQLRLIAESYRAMLVKIAEWKDHAMDDKTAFEMREEAKAALESSKEEK